MEPVKLKVHPGFHVPVCRNETPKVPPNHGLLPAMANTNGICPPQNSTVRLFPLLLPLRNGVLGYPRSASVDYRKEYARVVGIILNKCLMGTAFIATKKTPFAVFGCSVLHYLVASSMRTFYRRRYHANPPVLWFDGLYYNGLYPNSTFFAHYQINKNSSSLVILPRKTAGLNINHLPAVSFWAIDAPARRPNAAWRTLPGVVLRVNADALEPNLFMNML
jgi:hypothetical protein